VLFNDATYGPLTHAEAPASLFSGDGPRDARAIELHALSKCFGMTGVPISFLVGTPDEIDRLRTFAGFAWTPPSVGQIEIAIRCLSNADHLAALRDATRRRAERLRVTLEALGLRPYASGGGIFVICPAPRAIDGHDTPTPWDAARRLLDTHGVAAMPWPARPHGYLRFTASARPEDVDALASLRGSVRFEW
jgi:aspartate/methionine/tyrosine aminotransferase